MQLSYSENVTHQRNKQYMKQLLRLLTIFLFTTAMHAQEGLPEAEKKAIVAEVEEMMTAFNEGKAELLIEKTHPAILKLIPDGNEETFKKSMLAAAKQILDAGVTISDFKAELPGQLYKNDKSSVCFVPVSSVMSINGMKMASTSFLIAAKGQAGDWKYLDGSALGDSPEMLRTFFPNLPQDIELPEVKIEALKEE